MAKAAASSGAKHASSWLLWGISFVAFLALTMVGYLLTPDTFVFVLLAPIVAGLVAGIGVGGVHALLTRRRRGPEKGLV